MISSFQLTTSQGGRLLNLGINLHNSYFNSRPRKEVDNWSNYSLQLFRYFNSRPRKEVDVTNIEYKYPVVFQLTTSQGGRLTENAILILLDYFNSRPRKEVDHSNWYCSINFNISTHDLARRSTYYFACFCVCVIFQLTTSQGGRQYYHLL